MDVLHLLNSESGLTVLGAVVGGFWMLLRSTEWYGRIRNRRQARALQVLEAAVEQTYRVYVEAIKEGRADGHLTPEEKRRARKLAREQAVQIAKREGIDLLRELGPDYLDLWIAKLVLGLKGA